MNKQSARTRRGLKTKRRLAKSSLPRLVVFRSGKHIYGQIVNPSENGSIVLASCSTLSKELKVKGNKTTQAHSVGLALGKMAKKLKLERVSFDRSGYKYHGRIMALANGARESGLVF